MKLFLDLETFSPTEISCGVHRYAENVEILLFAYAFDDEPAKVVDFTAYEELPQRVLDAFSDPSVELWAHNSYFDRTVLKRFYPEVSDPHRWRDTMILAYAHSLPGSLGQLSEVLGLPVDKAKDKDGRRLVLLFCKPQPEYRRIRRATSETHPEDWEHFCEYCRLDVEAMREVWRRLPHWNESAYPLWQEWFIDQDINDRGMAIDLPLVHAAIKAADADKAVADKNVCRMTDGQVKSTGQRDELLKHILSTYGVPLPDMQKSTLERRLNDENLPLAVRELIALRLQSTKTSVQKFKALGNCTNADGRLRGCLQYMGAIRTGRWVGRLYQPQNLPRGTMKPTEVEDAISAIKAGVSDLLYDDVPQVLSNCIRGAIIAPPGKKLVVADLSNIEGRVLAWLAGEEWKLEAFRAYDRGEGPDLYKATYGRTFGINPNDVTKQQRQIGKVLELAMGYQGGVGAFISFARIYRVDLDELAVHTREAIDRRFWQEAEDAYDWFLDKGLTFDLSRETFIACEAIKRAWRFAHPAITKFWADIDAGCRRMYEGGQVTRAGKVMVGRKSKGYGAVLLPSGRYMCYPAPRAPRDGERATMVFKGINQYTRKWSDIKTFGGKLCIAKGTLVLCKRGWTPIEDVTSSDPVWDGVEWVSCGGSICNGVRFCISAYGISMTPDHLVLTTEGWKHASSCERHYRAPCWIPDGYSVPRIRRKEINLGRSMRLREGNSYSWFRAHQNEETRNYRVVRLYEKKNDEREALQTRDDQHSDMGCLAFHEGALRNSYRTSMAQLRRAWDHCLRTLVEVVRSVLCGYGTFLPAWVDIGSYRRQQGLLARELPVGHAQGTREQHTEDKVYRRSPIDLLGREDRRKAQHDSLSPCQWLPSRASVRQTECWQEVFDILNCGPRQRFVVAGKDGPVIVHNCENATQATARDVLASSLPAIEAAGYKIVLSVHDELITETPDSPEFTVEKLAAMMATPPAWAPDLPLSAAGFEAARYKKE